MKIYVLKQSNYPVDAIPLKNKLKKFLTKKRVSKDIVISIAIVGESKMKQLGKKYLDETETHPTHNVLSFTASEARMPSGLDKKKEQFVYPDEYVYFGEVVICFPVAFEEAKRERKRIDDKVYELVEHGVVHLMGVHHD